ncbi:hypothetical protein E3N88_40044 [Mikania micrantha]|uniref:Uncharacterized protein n=1 Tax=Mikania micrantha TaxID=192012 RepID=A0A5N6LLN3_9ASTR|nr:hypothetical protein E3N88_40044 [Mikania micrantha]
MAKQIKKTQSLTIEGNKYEKERQLRIQENKKRLSDLGVKNIVKSLTSLDESQQRSKIKVKRNSHVGDVDYIPGAEDDSEDDDQQLHYQWKNDWDEQIRSCWVKFMKKKVKNLLSRARNSAKKAACNANVEVGDDLSDKLLGRLATVDEIWMQSHGKKGTRPLDKVLISKGCERSQEAGNLDEINLKPLLNGLTPGQRILLNHIKNVLKRDMEMMLANNHCSIQTHGYKLLEEEKRQSLWF